MLYVVDSIDTWCLDSEVFLLYTLNDVTSEINYCIFSIFTKFGDFTY